MKISDNINLRLIFILVCLLRLPFLPFLAPQDELRAQVNLRNEFQNPAVEYAPWVWWHWMNGNVSKEGITLDLEAMKRVGIGGVVAFNGATGIPQGHLDYASDEWFEYNTFAMSEARRLGLKMMLHNAPGYSVTGAPWITPENSMQQMVWSETYISPDKPVRLPQPYIKMGYYEDIAVIAYPSLKGEETPMQNVLKGAKVNGKEINVTPLFDFNYDTYVDLTLNDTNKQGFLEFEFEEPFEAASIVIRRKHTGPSHHPYDGPRDNPPVLTLEYSQDGVHFTPLCQINMPAMRELDLPKSQNFKSVKAHYFRITTNKDTQLTELFLYGTPRLDSWESKANFTVNGNRALDLSATEVPGCYRIKTDEILDLTSYMTADGTLNWQPSQGNWTILRFGHTTTGEENAAAPTSGIGLECDKLNRRGIDAHYHHFLKRLFEELKDFAAKTFSGLITDSWEAGSQNWTKGFEDEYYRRQQKSIVPYLPAFTGRIVGSTTETENFLSDLRKIQATMLAENYHQALRNYCHEHEVSYLCEPYGDGPFESFEVAKYIDIPAGEFWAHSLYGGAHTNNQAGYLARVHGKKIAAAEALTAMPDLSKFTEYPGAQKGEGDWMFCNGINRLMFHTFAHQPHTTAKPGMTMGPFGTHFNRNQTWWEQSKEYMVYLRRCQFLLQQGRFVSNSSSWTPKGHSSDTTQKKDDFSYFSLNRNAVINYIHRKDQGTDYYLLANCKRAPERIIATFDVSGKQPELWYPETGNQQPVYNYKTENGKTIIPLNLKSGESVFVVFEGRIIQPALWNEQEDIRNILIKHQSYEDIQQNFTILVWLRPDVIAKSGRSFILYPENGEKLYGKNHAIIGLSVGQNGVTVFEQSAQNRKEVLFAPAKLEGWSLIHIVYSNGVPTVYVDGKKTATGNKSLYIVHPTNNELAPVDPVITLFQGEYLQPVILNKALEPKEIVQDVKKGRPDNESYIIDNQFVVREETTVIHADTPWHIELPLKNDAVRRITAKKLKSLHLYTDKEVKYFSGTASYTQTIHLPELRNRRALLDLGNVAFFAEVSINNQPVATCWKSPYTVDITTYIREGENHLNIKVTNLWTNRLIGDELLPEENTYDRWGQIDKLPDWYINNQPYTGKRNTFATWKQYDKNGPLTESGLVGPVAIVLY